MKSADNSNPYAPKILTEEQLLADPDWTQLADELRRLEAAALGASTRSDAEFVVGLRAGIERSQQPVPTLFNAGRKLILALSGLSIALLALLMYSGQKQLTQTDSAAMYFAQTEPSTVTDDSPFLEPDYFAELGEEIIPESLAAKLGIPDVLESMESGSNLEVTTEELLELDDDFLTAVMDEFETTQFF